MTKFWRVNENMDSTISGMFGSPEGVGSFVISLDTELAWGRLNHRDLEEYEERFILARDGIKWLLETFEEFSVPATWAMVGHLFLEECSVDSDGVRHPELVHPTYEWMEGDWYQLDPATNQVESPEFYGVDILRDILASSVTHEVGSHSFGHIRFGDPGCSRAAAVADLEYCQQLAGQWEIELDSFVFPQDRIGHLEVLDKVGFMTYRGVLPGALPGHGMSRLSYLASCLLGLPAPVGLPRIAYGKLIDVPLSMHLRHDKPISSTAGFVPMAAKTRRALGGLRLAASRAEVFHLGLHPIDFGWNGEGIRKALRSILSKARDLSDQGELELSTMREVARAFQNVPGG